MKKLITITAILLACVNAQADISWFVDANPIMGPDDTADRLETDFATPLAGNRFQATGGYFVQLLYAGLDGAPNAIDPRGIDYDVWKAANQPTLGAQGDDVVVSTRFIGAGKASGNVGIFNSGNPFAADVQGGNYFVRAWTGISPTDQTVRNGAADAELPPGFTDGGVGSYIWYGDSATWNNPGDGDGVPIIHNVDFSATGGFAADQLIGVAIPEPSSFALLGLGGLLMVVRMRRKK